VLFDPPKGWRIESEIDEGGPVYRIYLLPADGVPLEGEAWLLQPACFARALRTVDEQGNQDIGGFRDLAFFDRLKRTWGKRDELVSADRYIEDDIVKVIVIADRTSDECAKLHCGRSDRRVMKAYLASHKAVVDIYCSATQSRFEELQPMYYAIVRGVTFPK
jgi:hypothetical protein